MSTRVQSLVTAATIARAASANAGTVLCGGERAYLLTSEPTATCLRTGARNISGNNDAINRLSPGFATLDKSHDASSGALRGALTITGQGATGGTFAIDPRVYSLYDEIVLGFQSGAGQMDPDGAAFLLADGTFSGSWLITGQQALSHVNLYGRGTPGGATGRGSPVWLPGTLAMLGVGFAGMAAVARRRKRMVV